MSFPVLSRRPVSCLKTGQDSHVTPPVETSESVSTSQASCPSFLHRAIQDLSQELACVVKPSVLPDLVVGSKEEVIHAMVDSLAKAGALAESQQQAVAESILTREALGTTGIGRGIAIPHTKINAVDQPIATMARIPGGVDYDSLDAEPVHFVFMLVSPPDQANEHIRALATVSRYLSNCDYHSWRQDERHVED